MEKLFLVVWLGLLPTQLGKFIWPEWSFVAGVRVDYLAWVLYLNDLIWLAWWIAYGRKENQGRWFWILVAINLFGSRIWEVSLFRWWRWFMLLLMVKRWTKGWRLLENSLRRLIPVWFGVEFIMSIGQLATGGSLQGIFYWLGERKFSYMEPGIATMKLGGESLVRAYGTFSHPNSLAGFVGLCLIWWWSGYKKTKFWWTVNWIGLGLIVATGSRVAWISLLFIGLGWKPRHRFKKILLALMVLMISVWVGVGTVGWDVDGFDKRIELAKASWLIVNKYWFLGVGLGNNIVAGAAGVWIKNKYWLQPVHNIFLLAFSELGLIGTSIFLFRIRKVARKISLEKWKVMALGFILTTGTIDHYWLTLPQNMGLLAIIFVLIYDKRNSS